MASPLSYTPLPNEQAYYEGLFQAADVQHTNNIGGAQAVAFFTRSKLPTDALKGIWTVADQPSTSSLNRAKFAVAVRLIQLAQNGQKGQGPNLSAPNGVNLRPAFFEGVSGVSVQMPQAAGPPPGAQNSVAPPPHQQQQQQQPGQGHGRGQPPLSPNRNSQALVAQDPFALLPQERARYEGMFPQYAKDGFVHGKDAFDLFMKSGVSQQNLRQIWTMVDTPPDNKLDPLEFAMAMHLIVCVSKKNLQLPTNGLPPSLQQLKQPQQHMQQQPPPQMQQQPPPPQMQQPKQQMQQQPPPPQMQQQPQSQMQQMGQGQQMGQLDQIGIPSPKQGQYGNQQFQIPSPQQQQARNSFQGSDAPNSGLSPAQSLEPRRSSAMGGGPPPIQSSNSLPGPPPLAQSGGASISDAFEGLSTTSAGVSSLPPLSNDPSSFSMGQPSMNGVHHDSASLPPQVERGNFSMGERAPEIETISERGDSPTPMMHNSKPPPSTKELASSYNLSNSTGELEKLKSVLQKLQAENISLKAQLGNMSDEEKDIQKELGATVAEIGKLSNELTTLRAQVLAAKSRLLESTSELKSAKERKSVLTDLISEARDTKNAIEEARTSIEDANISSNVQQQRQQQAVQQSNTFEANLFDFDASLSNGNADQSNFPAPDTFQHQLRDSHNSGPPSIQPSASAESQSTAPSHEPVDQPALNLVPDEPMSIASSYGMGSYGMDTQNSTNKPKAIHNRVSSNAFAQEDFIMGGQARPISSTVDGLSPAARSASNLSDYGVDEASSASIQNMDNLRKKIARAEDVARDAQEALQQAEYNADELRQRADKAEANAKELTKAAGDMKKGAFGGGKKKKQAEKEAERMAAESNSLRQQFVASQSQVNDAKLVVDQTRQEVEKLRNRLEQAELDAAAAASMLDQQKPKESSPPSSPAKTFPNAPPNSYSYDNGHSTMGGGVPFQNDNSMYGFGEQENGPPPLSSMPQNDDQNNFDVYGGLGSNAHGYGNGFGSGVMGGGGGGFDLPSPNQLPGGDSYDNPFSS